MYCILPVAGCCHIVWLFGGWRRVCGTEHCCVVESCWHTEASRQLRLYWAALSRPVSGLRHTMKTSPADPRILYIEGRGSVGSCRLWERTDVCHTSVLQQETNDVIRRISTNPLSASKFPLSRSPAVNVLLYLLYSSLRFVSCLLFLFYTPLSSGFTAWLFP